MGEADKRGWKRVLSEVRRVIVFFLTISFRLYWPGLGYNFSRHGFSENEKKTGHRIVFTRSSDVPVEIVSVIRVTGSFYILFSFKPNSGLLTG
jgi:hypothetical protein